MVGALEGADCVAQLTKETRTNEQTNKQTPGALSLVEEEKVEHAQKQPNFSRQSAKNCQTKGKGLLKLAAKR